MQNAIYVYDDDPHGYLEIFRSDGKYRSGLLKSLSEQLKNDKELISKAVVIGRNHDPYSDPSRLVEVRQAISMMKDRKIKVIVVTKMLKHILRDIDLLENGDSIYCFGYSNEIDYARLRAICEHLGINLVSNKQFKPQRRKRRC